MENIHFNVKDSSVRGIEEHKIPETQKSKSKMQFVNKIFYI